jgi:hypothetical protein
MDRQTGQCLCGACRFEATPDSNEAAVCHCSMCRKWTGGINIAVGCHDAVWNEGAPLNAYRSSDWAERVSCAVCGSNLYWRSLAAAAGDIVISLNAFDHPEVFRVTRQIFIDEKPAAYALAGSMDTMTAAEVRARWSTPPTETA